MDISKPRTPLLLALAAATLLAVLLAIPWAAQAQSDATAPSGLTASIVDDGVALSWAAPTENADAVTGYEILRRRPNRGENRLEPLVEDTQNAATSYTDTTATEAGTRYTYRVKAIRDGTKSAWSNYATVRLAGSTPTKTPTPTSTPTPSPTPAATPEPTPSPTPDATEKELAPSGLTAQMVDIGIILSWTPPAADAASVTGYQILGRRLDTNPRKLLTSVNNTESTETSLTAEYLNEPSSRYMFWVKAWRGEEKSNRTNKVTVERPVETAERAPSGLTLAVSTGSDLSTNSVNLTWNAPAEEAGSVTGYHVQRSASSGALTTLVANTESTNTAYSDLTATEPRQTYAYIVVALRDGLSSLASNRAEVALPPPPEQLVPQNLTASREYATGSTVTVSGVSLAWDPPAEDSGSVTGYHIQRAVSTEEMATLVGDTQSTTTTHTDTTATTPGETYTYAVTALRGERESLSSNHAGVVIPTPADLAPSNLIAEMTDEGVNLSWNPPSEQAGSISNYEVTRTGEVPGDANLHLGLQILPASPTAWTDTYDHTSGGTYTYVIRARRGSEKSLWSNAAIIQVEGESPFTEPQADFLTVNPPETELVVSNTGKNVDAQRGVGVNISARAQSFQVGTDFDLYRLTSVGIRFNQIVDPSHAGDDLFATLATYNSSNHPGSTLCILENPDTFVADAVNTFMAPAGADSCPVLENGAKYFFVLNRAGQQASTIELDVTTDKSEDPDGAAGWYIKDDRSYYSNGNWLTDSDNVHMIEVSAGTNHEASGAPTLSGSPTLGQVLTADISGIQDSDGFDPTQVSYQWRRDGGDISGATSREYTVTRDDLNEILGIQVTFNDMAGFPEGPFNSPTVRILMPNHLLVHNAQQGLLSFNATLNTQGDQRAQAFTTGPASGKFTLSSVAVRINQVDDGFSVGDLRATVNADSGGNPGSSLCTLSNPDSVQADKMAHFTAPGDDCPELDRNTTYFFVLERHTNTGSKSIGLRITSATGENEGGAPGWNIANKRHNRSGGSWSATDNEVHFIFVLGYHPDQDDIEEDGSSESGPPPPAQYLVKNTGQTSNGFNSELNESVIGLARRSPPAPTRRMGTTPTTACTQWASSSTRSETLRPRPSWQRPSMPEAVATPAMCSAPCGAPPNTRPTR